MVRPRNLQNIPPISPKLDSRDAVKRVPGLINLPLPIESIPILGPILTPIIGDSNQKPAPTTTKQSKPPTSPTSDPGGSGGNSGGNGGGGGGGGDTPPTTTPSGTTDPTPPGNNPTDSSSTPQSTESGAPPSDPDHPSNPSRPSVPNNGLPANAGDNPDDQGVHTNGFHIESTTIYSNGQPVATKPITVNNGSGGEPSGDTNNPSGGSKKLPTAAIAGVVVFALMFFFVLLLVLMRRRSKGKRSARRTWWANNRQWASDNSTDATVGSGTMSVRSSFATTYDHSTTARHSMVMDFTPPLPQTAEIRDSHGPGLLLHSQPTSPKVAPPSPLVNLDTPSQKLERQNSTYSNRSSSSDGHAQYLMSDPFAANGDGISPMSVRPFSPSELFYFPKPPASGDYTAAAANLQLPAVDEAEVVDPFADSVKFEIISRPFNPTLHDEIAVAVGDQVRISKVFDDGWALIEKHPVNSVEKGKAKMVQGLIPIDCLRTDNEPLPDYLITKRVSSQGALIAV